MTGTRADSAKMSAVRAARRAMPESVWARALVIGIFDVSLAAALTWVWILLAVPQLSADEFSLIRLPMIIIGPIAVLRPARWWPYLVFASVAVWWVHVLAGFEGADGFWHPLSEVGVTAAAAALVRGLHPVPMHSMTGAWRLLGVAAGAAAARIGLVQFHDSELLRGVRWPALTLGAGAGISVLVFLPLAILLADGLRHWAHSRQRLPTELPAITSFTALLWLMFYAPSGDKPLGMAFLVLPVLVAFAATLSQLAVAIGLALTVALVTDATGKGLGPLAPGSVRMDLLNVQVFLLSVAAFVWFVAGAVAAQRLANQSLAAAGEELQRLVDTDLVTGLRSRSWVIAELGRLFERRGDAAGRVAVMFIDLTEFLSVNRTLGYGAGDEILGSVASAVAEAAPGGYRVGRFDGHCLAVTVPDAEDVEEMEKVAHAMLTVIAGEIVVGGQRISRTGSIGIAVASRDSTPMSLLRDADLALVTAKSKGRSRIHLHVPSFDSREAAQDMHLEHELREALDECRFVVHFQPQVSLETDLVCGYEALARWDHPARGLLAPSAFMKTMESSGLVIQLGQQVLEFVCHVIATTPDLPGPISVNVSAVEFSDEDWFDRFTRTVIESGIRPELLVVELTETTVLHLTDDTANALAGIRELGVGIHVDDFGTGYASVGMLQRVPATALKLDRTFIAPMQDDLEVNVPLVRGIAGLAEGMGLETIAEGIETPEQADLLRDAGWRIGQGYFFGRPALDLVW